MVNVGALVGAVLNLAVIGAMLYGVSTEFWVEQTDELRNATGSIGQGDSVEETVRGLFKACRSYSGSGARIYTNAMNVSVSVNASLTAERCVSIDDTCTFTFNATIGQLKLPNCDAFNAARVLAVVALGLFAVAVVTQFFNARRYKSHYVMVQGWGIVVAVAAIGIFLDNELPFDTNTSRFGLSTEREIKVRMGVSASVYIAATVLSCVTMVLGVVLYYKVDRKHAAAQRDRN